jgi:hypothetical protein
MEEHASTTIIPLDGEEEEERKERERERGGVG